jgi:uncharacterized protein (DUF2236 family)
MARDEGFFGPDSLSWKVHREITVLLGGARALLMQAAHPLVIAGARETGFYERNPWKRLERTLQLTYTITFGTREESQRAADRINDVHSRVNGTDPVTGKHYDAFDPALLLWVHACLVDSALLFEERTVGALDEAGRDQFHREQMLVAEMLRTPRDIIPPTARDLRAYIDDVVKSDDLLVTDSARRVAGLFEDPPPEATWRPVLKLASRWAFGTLPPSLRAQYGVRWTRAHDVATTMGLRSVKLIRPLLPPKVRYIQPAIDRARELAV